MHNTKWDYHCFYGIKLVLSQYCIGGKIKDWYSPEQAFLGKKFEFFDIFLKIHLSFFFCPLSFLE